MSDQGKPPSGMEKSILGALVNLFIYGPKDYDDYNIKLDAVNKEFHK